MTAFDENVDALGLIEDHAKAVLALENEQAQKLLDVYDRVALTLRARLRATPRDSYTAQTIRVTLAQLEGAIRALQGKLYEVMDDGATKIADTAVTQLVAEIDTFNAEFNGALQPINLDLVQVAMNVKDRLINRYQASLDAYSASLRQTISDGLMTMVVERVGAEEINRRLLEQDAIGAFFEGEAWRLRRIVRTELHGMYGSAKLASLGRFAEDTPELRKALYHPQDNRTGDDSQWLIRETAAGRLNGSWNGIDRRLRPLVDEAFEYTWVARRASTSGRAGKPTGKRYRRIFLAPPDRPNDRAILIPYHPAWE